MADLVAMRTMFGRLGFSDDATHAMADAEGQNLDNLDDFAQLTDTEVESLCAIVRRPGGTVDDGHGVQIPNRGVNVSFLSEKKFKLAVYFVKHKRRCSEAVAINDITVANITALQSLYDQEKAHKEPDITEAEKIIDKRNWNKTFENLDDFIGKHLGLRGNPLTYLCRENQAPTAAPVGGWVDERLHMIERGPHFANNAAGNPVPTPTFNK